MHHSKPALSPLEDVGELLPLVDNAHINPKKI